MGKVFDHKQQSLFKIDYLINKTLFDYERSKIIKKRYDALTEYEDEITNYSIVFCLNRFGYKQYLNYSIYGETSSAKCKINGDLFNKNILIDDIKYLEDQIHFFISDIFEIFRFGGKNLMQKHTQILFNFDTYCIVPLLRIEEFDYSSYCICGSATEKIIKKIKEYL